MAAEEFTFPPLAADADSSLSILESPPLWRNSSTPHSQPIVDDREAIRKQGGDDELHMPNLFKPNPLEKSLSAVDEKSTTATVGGGGGEENDEEKMDKLWEEDDNEESSLRIKSKPKLPDTMVKLRSPAIAYSCSKPGLAVLMSALKKLFVVRRSHHRRRLKQPAAW